MSRSESGSPLRLSEMTWPEVEALRRPVLLIALGSTEQHGPHLPLDTDLRIARALCEAAAAHRPGTVIGPEIAVGASGEHGDFAGTLSIGTDVLLTVLVELGRSADRFGSVIFVNGHGGNHEAVTAAVARLVGEGRSVHAWWPPPDRSVESGDAHAGWIETSVMMAIAPDSVRTDRLEPGAAAPLTSLMKDIRAHGMRSVTANGVLGDPTSASPDRGRDVLGRWTGSLLDLIDGMHP